MAKKLALLSALLVVMAIAATPSAAQGSDPDLAANATASPTTAAPATTTAAPTTAAPATTTAAPTTAAPATTTAAPTTAAPATTTASPTTAAPAPTTAAVTTKPGPTTATTKTAPPTTATTLLPTTTTTESPDPCVSNPCGQGSTCEGRADGTYACLCLPGDSYNNPTQTCQKAKVYPGKLGLTKLPYTEDMKNKKSQAFKEASDKIISAIGETFTVEYTGATVLELRELKTPARSGGVDASVEILFEANAKIDQKQVEDALKNPTCTDCVLKDSTFTAGNLCNSQPCDKQTTKCTPADGSFTCSCSDGYIPTEFSDKICLQCPSGTEYIKSECVACPFGYTGVNCNDDWLLVLVIVGSVLGGLLLITLILLPVMAMKMKKKGPKSKDIGKPYVSHSIAKAPAADSSVHNGYSSSYQGSNNAGAASGGAPRIPRATSNWDSNTNLEMTPSNSRQNLISSGRNTQQLYDDQVDMFTFDQSRPQSSSYAQIQAQRNPYAQVRATNPYAQSQASSNPYAM